MATATAQINKNALTRMVGAAKTAGVPKDALERFLAAGYVPQPRQMLFHAAARECDKRDGPTEVGFGGARGPGKSHGGLAQVGIDDCQRAEGLKFLFLRKVGKAARESFEDLRLKVLRNVSHEYKRQAGILELSKTGSRIVLGHFNSESDIDNYLGVEYDGALIEESNQLSLSKHQQIRTCIRTSRMDWRPRIYHTFNPGGVGHQHTKAKFIVPWRKGEESATRFVFATYRDNRFLNPEYEQSLNALSGWLKAAWRDGDWDIAAGQFFTNWRHDAVVKTLDPLPAHWPVWCGLDYGFTHPTTCYLLSEFDGKRIVVDEYCEAKKLVPQNAQGIKDMLARNGVLPDRLRGIFAGHDVFAVKGDQFGKTIAQQYEEEGIRLQKANIDRVNGAGELLKLLGDLDNGIEPKIVVSDRCARLIECIPALQHDPHRPEDVLKVDVDEDGNGGDDPYDGVRYGLMAKYSQGAWF